MNETPTPNDNSEDFPDNIDKTIDENIMANQTGQGTGLQPGVTNVPAGMTNPFQAQELPSGEDPIPLGSGIIAGVLGVGGMAKVYKIWNEKLEVYRAVKILLPSGQKDLANRFETEVKITAKLHHPNIVDIYNVGEWNGLPYIEMEIVDGTTLDSLIGKYGKLPDILCCAIGIQMANALSYAHTQDFLIYGKTYNGIIHRDLKPANIMISNHGDLKLMDFGIARPTEVGLHTLEGHIVGTLQYLSPEQLDGVSIDNRTDVYSFGAILYELLTGTKTFPQSTITNLMKMKATNAFRKFNEFDFVINNQLVKCTEKCLQHERTDRFDSAKALEAALQKIHASMITEPPHDVIKNYMQDPYCYESTSGKKKISPRYLMIGGALAAIIAIIIIISTVLLKKEPEKIAKQKETIRATKPATKTVDKEKARLDSLKRIAIQKTIAKNLKPEKTPPVRKPVAVSTPRRDTPPVKKPPKKISPVDKLKKKYQKNDLLAIGEEACKKGSYTDAITALQASSGNDPKKFILLMWAYVELNKIKSAQNIAVSVQGKDAFVDLLKGRIESSFGNDNKALGFYQSALTKPSQIKNRTAIRNDALYYTALIRDRHYKQSPSSETRIQALTAWNNLKKIYKRNQDHPRFKLANKKLATTY